MTKTSSDPVALAQALVRCPSVTPEEGGALDFLQSVLSREGFTCERLLFSEAGTADVDNLFARIGTSGPHLCFAGHTDVVPVGDEATWTHPPFAAEIYDGVLYGRGAVDMKGGVACFLAATLRYLRATVGIAPGSISFLITGDEEAIAVNGTVKVLDWMAANSHSPSHSIVGEPTNPESIGDEIKIGRRGSLTGRLTILGKQGHVAYQHVANNPVRGLAPVLSTLMDVPLDEGSEHFQSSNLEVTTVDVGNNADNVIPARVTATFNVRFNDHHGHPSLRDLLRSRIDEALANSGLSYELEFYGSSEVFLTEPGELAACMTSAVHQVTRRLPKLSTAGGTSDARFIKNFCPVLEFGLLNQTAHQVDERVPVAHLEQLTQIYERFIERYFEVFAQ